MYNGIKHYDTLVYKFKFDTETTKINKLPKKNSEENLTLLETENLDDNYVSQETL